MDSLTRQQSRRYAEKAKGRCFNGDSRPAAPGRVLCVECLVHLRQRREEARASGLCVSLCGRPVKKGRALCFDCLDERRQRNQKLLADGLCQSCRKPNPNGQTKCEVCKHRHLAARFGLSEEECTKLFKACAGCFVCGGTELLVIDHDHRSGKVRGVLCKQCNIALGGAKDNPETLTRLIAYLASPPAEQILGEARYQRGKIYPNNPNREVKDGRGWRKLGRRPKAA